MLPLFCFCCFFVIKNDIHTKKKKSVIFPIVNMLYIGLVCDNRYQKRMCPLWFNNELKAITVKTALRLILKMQKNAPFNPHATD